MLQQTGAGRLKTLQDGSTTAYEYTADGKLSIVTDATGVTQFFYNAQGLLERRIGPSGLELSYGYDLAGNITAITSLSGTTSYVYNAAGRVSSVTGFAGNTTGFTYDAIGNIVAKVLPNGTRELRSYNASSQLTQVQFVAADGTVLRQFTYVIGSSGRYSAVTELGGRVVLYGYDDTGRLTSETIQVPGQPDHSISYVYDVVGNRVSATDSLLGVTTFTYDDNDQLLSRTQAGVRTDYAYDANGSLISEVSVNRRVAYEWSTERQLLSVDTTENGVNTVVSYTYDFAGNRIATTVGGERVRYLVDYSNRYAQVLDEVSDTGTVIAGYVYAEKLLSQTRGGSSYFYLADGHSGVRVLQSDAEQTVNEYTYDAFGVGLSTVESVRNPYQYRGERLDSSTAQYYLRARIYDQRTGRFLSTDPRPGKLNAPQSQHRYLYANANPVLFSDPSGEAPTIAEVTISLSIAGILAAISQQVVGIIKAGFSRDVIWKGPNIFFSIGVGGVGKFGGKEPIFDAALSPGITFQTTTRNKLTTEAIHLVLTTSVSVELEVEGPETASDVVPSTGSTGGMIGRAFYLIFGWVPNKVLGLIDFSIGDAEIASQTALGGANGTEPFVLNWFYGQFATAVSAPAILAPLFGGQNSFGVSMVLQGFAIGASIPDTGFSSGAGQGFKAGAGINGGISINLTPDDKVNQPAK